MVCGFKSRPEHHEELRLLDLWMLRIPKGFALTAIFDVPILRT